MESLAKNVKCGNCGKPFHRKKSHIFIHVFCSRNCMYEYRRKQGILNAKKCENCGHPVRKGKRFCSQSCFFRYMWATTWKHKRKGKWMPAKKNFATIVLRVPNTYLTDFEFSLRHLIREFNQDYGRLVGKVMMNILGERRLMQKVETT